MTVLLKLEHRVAGTVKFHSSVPVEKLTTFIAELKSRNTDRWVDIHIRPAGDSGAHYIGVHYILADGRKKTQWKEVRSFLQYFCDQLGPCPVVDKRAQHPVAIGVMGWSLSTVVVTI